MPSKYTTPAEREPQNRLLTNDVYLAAFLLTRGCRLTGTLHNERRRVSFVCEGENVGELRRAYRSGPVYLNLRFFRDRLNHLRHALYGNERSASCPPSVTRMQSLPA